MTDDKLTIEDLLIRRSLPERGLRDATEADLLAVLEGLGAYVSECSEIVDYEGRLIAHPGTYLVWGPL